MQKVILDSSLPSGTLSEVVAQLSKQSALGSWTVKKDADEALERWIWNQWDRVEQAGSVRYYTWMGRRSDLRRDEAVGVVVSFFKKYAKEGATLSDQAITEHARKTRSYHQISPSVVSGAIRDVLNTHSDYFTPA